MIQGNFENLSKSLLATWRGWAIFHWDMCHSVALFQKKPAQYEEGRWEFNDAIEGVHVQFLKACGIVVGNEDEDFYYGGELCGEHPPIEIELTLPQVILEQLGLL